MPHPQDPDPRRTQSVCAQIHQYPNDLLRVRAIIAEVRRKARYNDFWAQWFYETWKQALKARCRIE
jgi:hypothetical protein